jgi:hypothetical protein
MTVLLLRIPITKNIIIASPVRPTAIWDTTEFSFLTGKDNPSRIKPIADEIKAVGLPEII